VVALVIAGLRVARGQEQYDPLMQRLEEATQRGDVVTSLEQIEMQQPFTQRVIVPFLQRVGDLSSSFTPQKVLEDTSRKLEIAGNPGRVDAATFLASRFIVAIFFGGILLMVGLFAPNRWALGQTILVVAAFTLLGFFFPQLWLQGRINARQKEIRKAMPDALDLLTICVEAGLGFEAAMSKVSEKWENQLSLALNRTIREIQLGKARRDAMRDMADRIGIPEMTSFVAAIIQSEVLGVSLAKVLRIQSDQMRVRRRQRAEEQAHQAPVKMILPLAFLIFPSIFIILLTPAGIQLSKSFGNIGP
jgi:tight adherence protein C